jgi:hypothetical protein
MEGGGGVDVSIPVWINGLNLLGEANTILQPLFFQHIWTDKN